MPVTLVRATDRPPDGWHVYTTVRRGDSITNPQCHCGHSMSIDMNATDDGGRWQCPRCGTLAVFQPAYQVGDASVLGRILRQEKQDNG